MKTDDYENCIPLVFNNNLTLLLSSFDGFINRNYDGDLKPFIISVVNRKFPDKSDFIPSDYEVGRHLRTTNFEDFIYSEYEEKLSDSGIEVEPPRTAGQAEEPKRMMIKVDLEKPYLKCLNTVSTEGNLINEYLALQKGNAGLSPLVVGELFIVHKNDPDYGTKLANTIIAVELYYMILYSATRGSY